MLKKKSTSSAKIMKYLPTCRIFDGINDQNQAMACKQTTADSQFTIRYLFITYWYLLNFDSIPPFLKQIEA